MNYIAAFEHERFSGLTKDSRTRLGGALNWPNSVGQVTVCESGHEGGVCLGWMSRDHEDREWGKTYGLFFRAGVYDEGSMVLGNGLVLDQKSHVLSTNAILLAGLEKLAFC